MDDKDEIFEDDTKRESVPVAIALLKARVGMLTYLFKHELVSKHEFAPVKLIAYGVVGVLVAALGALLLYLIKQN